MFQGMTRRLLGFTAHNEMTVTDCKRMIFLFVFISSFCGVQLAFTLRKFVICSNEVSLLTKIASLFQWSTD